MTGSVSTDYFLDQAIAVQQLKGVGHRSGMDAIMLAATLPGDLAGQVADLGSGAGVVGMAIAHRCQDCRVDLVEIDSQLVNLNRRSLELEQNRHIADRISVCCADIAQPDEPLVSTTRKPGSYAAIVFNPPYNDAAHQASPDTSRALAHMASATTPKLWVKKAANMAAHRGLLALIARPQNLADYMSAISTSFGNVIVKPLHGRADEPARRLLIGSRKGSRAALQMLPPLVLHQLDGAYTREAENILRGRGRIDLFA